MNTSTELHVAPPRHRQQKRKRDAASIDEYAGAIIAEPDRSKMRGALDHSSIDLQHNTIISPSSTQDSTDQDNTIVVDNVTQQRLCVEPFIHLQELNVVICRVCRFAVCCDEILTHLNSGPHRRRYKMSERKDIQRQVKSIPGIIQSQIELKTFKYPPRDNLPVPFIAPPEPDGMLCDACPYISRQPQGIREHCRTMHQWVNDWNPANNFRGMSQEGRKVPWTTNVHCQRLFRSRAASGWFEVQRSVGV